MTKLEELKAALEAVDLLKEADADFGDNRSQEKRLETSLNIERFVCSHRLGGDLTVRVQPFPEGE